MTEPERRKPIHPWRWRILAVWIVVFSVTTAYALRLGTERSNDIQKSREDVALVACKDTNLRHKETARVLTEITRVHKQEARQELTGQALTLRLQSLDTGLAQTLLLIDALVPVRDCHALVQSIAK